MPIPNNVTYRRIRTFAGLRRAVKIGSRDLVIASGVLRASYNASLRRGAVEIISLVDLSCARLTAANFRQSFYGQVAKAGRLYVEGR